MISSLLVRHREMAGRGQGQRRRYLSSGVAGGRLLGRSRGSFVARGREKKCPEIRRPRKSSPLARSLVDTLGAPKIIDTRP